MQILTNVTLRHYPTHAILVICNFLDWFHSKEAQNTTAIRANKQKDHAKPFPISIRMQKITLFA